MKTLSNMIPSADNNFGWQLDDQINDYFWIKLWDRLTYSLGIEDVASYLKNH